MLFLDFKLSKNRVLVRSVINGHEIISFSVFVNFIIIITSVFLEVKVDIAIKADSERFLSGSWIF